jgi:suppressor for copper-sensitivity B
MRKLCLVIGLLWALVAVAAVCSPAAAQTSLFNGLSAAADNEPTVTVSAEFSADAESRRGQLSITAEMAEGWHIYSITQPSGGPIRTKIKLDPNGNFKLLGEFKPSEAPKTHVDDLAFKGLTLEEHEGSVTWTAPIELAAGVDPAQLRIAGNLFGQTCREGQCNVPQDYPFTAVLAPATDSNPPAAEPAEADDTGVYDAGDITFRGYVTPRMVVPGGKFKLVIAAEPAQGWHIYELSDKPPSATGSKPTLIVLTQTSGLKNAPAVASQPPVADEISTIRVHEEPVTWTIELTAPSAAKRGPVKIEGLLGYQICTAKNCQSPSALGFEVKVALGAQTVEGQVPLKFDAKPRYKDVEKLVKNPAANTGRGSGRNKTRGDKTSLLNPDEFKPAGSEGSSTSLVRMIGFGFLGGLILNLMPCVLPVIGLKILSFLEQSGHSRRQAFLLNLWYSLGMMAVFMALATLPVVARLWFNQDFGWGQQFSYVGFNITLAAIVFAMALSFLGVWEIPIPGFVGGSTANQLAAKEGFSGAFAKGAITTVLATPCSGPFLGTALGFALAQPPLIIYAMFASIGLGMASPYLLIGAYPQLMRWLPKPGAWMDTFKQLMGFALLGTVVYLMHLVGSNYFIPTLTLLFGLWLGCWWIGRTPLYAELPTKLQAWAGGATAAALVGVFAFYWLAAPQSAELPWRPFSLQELTRLTAEGKTVMLDFTADWCPTCKVLEQTVLNTPETKELIERNGIVPMVADLTTKPEEEMKFLSSLKAKLIPVLAIFPAGRPNEPIVLRDAYTQGLLFEKLKEAGPSRDAQVASLTAR